MTPYRTDSVPLVYEFDVSKIKNISSGSIQLKFSSLKGTLLSDFSYHYYFPLKCTQLDIEEKFGYSSNGKTYSHTFTTNEKNAIITNDKLIFEISSYVYDVCFRSYNDRDTGDQWVDDEYINGSPLNEQYIEYTYTEPNVSYFAVSGTSIDSDITFTCTYEDVEYFTVYAILNENVVATKTGTTITDCTFPLGSLTLPGEYTFKLIATYSGNTVESSQTVILTNTVPTITSLEPNGVNQLKSSNINISFSGTNITSYSIVAKHNGVSKWSNSGNNTSGLTSFSFSMIKNLFDIGNVTLELTCTYSNGYYSTTTTQTATFLVYGAPSTPIISGLSEYTTPTPTFNFTCADSYISYQVEIDGIQKTETYGTPNKYRITDALSNNDYHTFKVRVKNQYQLWSEWASLTFLVSYAELIKPLINAYADDNNGCIVINAESEEQENFHNHSIFRSEDGTVWTEIAVSLGLSDSYTDLTCASGVNYLYKVRANDINGGIKDSEIVTCKCEFKNLILSVPYSDKSIVLKYFADESGLNKPMDNNTSRTFTQVCGLSKPKSKRTDLEYLSFGLELAFKTKESFEEFITFKDEEILLLRDSRGLKIYCDMAINKFQDYLHYYKSVSVTFTEVYYKEGDYEEAPSTAFTYTKNEW